MEPTTRRIQLNIPQMVALNAKQLRRHIEAGRGTGKSFFLALIMREMIMTMPRGKFALPGASFKQILGETLPSTIEGLEKIGLHQNVHYYMKRAPRKLGWPEPYQPPMDWANFIHFYTGAAFSLVSQDKSSVERRGQNFDGVIGDEAAQLDPVRLFNEVLAGNRTVRREFEDKPLFHAEIFTSTTPLTKAGKWFIENELKAQQNPKTHFHLRASARHNLKNLTPGWFDRMRSEAPSELHYLAEIENIRPPLVENSYYPKLAPKRHYYNGIDGDHYLNLHVTGRAFKADCQGDADRTNNKGLILAIDPGAAINTLVVMQINEHKRELRTLNSFFRLSPDIVQDCVEHDFIPYYSLHGKKTIELFYDRTAANRQANKRTTVAQDVIKILKRFGWSVIDRSAGHAVIRQDDKFHDIAIMHAETHPNMLRSRINQENNRDLIISLENTGTLTARNGSIKKDKRSERRLSTPRQHATDFGDAYDLPCYYYARKALRGQQHIIETQLI